MSDALDTRTPANKPPPSFESQIQALAQHHLVKMAGEEKGKQLAAGAAMTIGAAARVNPQIRDCTPDSVAAAVAMTIYTGLQPGGPAPHVYLLPRSNRRQVNGEWVNVNELQWMVSWRGLAELARRSGYGIRAVAVHEGDSLTNLGTEETGMLDLLSWSPPALYMGDGARTWDTLRGVVVVAYDLSTKQPHGWEWVPRSTIEARRDVSDAYKRGMDPNKTDGFGRNKTTRPKTADEIEQGKASPWFKWPVEMALKSGVRYAISRGIVPLDVAASSAVQADDEADREVIDVEPVSRPTGATEAVRARLTQQAPPNEVQPTPERVPVPVATTTDPDNV